MTLPLLAAFAAGLTYLLWRMQQKKGWKGPEKVDDSLANVLTTPQERQAIEMNTAPIQMAQVQEGEMVMLSDGTPAPKIHYAVTGEYLMRGVVNVKVCFLLSIDN